MPFFVAEALGKAVRVLVTMPRRLAATTAAHRCASEFNQEVGATIGFWIGQDRRAGDDTVVTFATAGALH